MKKLILTCTALAAIVLGYVLLGNVLAPPASAQNLPVPSHSPQPYPGSGGTSSTITFPGGLVGSFDVLPINVYGGAANMAVFQTIPDSSGLGMKTKATLYTISGGTCNEVCSTVITFTNP